MSACDPTWIARGLVLMLCTMQKVAALAVLGTLLFACQGKFLYTPSSARAVPAKAKGCDFEVLTTRPSRPFQEIGFLELDSDVAAPQDLTSFRNRARNHVCAGGGDAVIAYPNNEGEYTKGTVLRYDPSQ